MSHAGEKGRVTIATNMAGRGTDIKPTPEVTAAGGLHVLGTERHEARRIDRQLEGRSGRGCLRRSCAQPRPRPRAGAGRSSAARCGARCGVSCGASSRLASCAPDWSLLVRL